MPSSSARSQTPCIRAPIHDPLSTAVRAILGVDDGFRGGAQDAVARQLPDELVDVARARSRRRSSNSRQTTSATIACSGRSAVGRFPDGRADGVEHVEARVVGAEDHHLAADLSGREARRPSR